VPVWLGTSGWAYGHWRGGLYPAGVPTARWLEAYASGFATVELNASFYRLPAATAFAGWRRRTPDGFVMAVKASRYLTHVRRLRDPAEPAALLMERAEHLGDRLGPVLLQLPPGMKADAPLLAEALDAFPPGLRITVEPRDPSWFSDAVREVLTARGAALCLADRPGWRPPVWRTAGWTYLRMHEGRAAPRPCYGRAALGSWAERLAAEWGPDEDVYVYFNNDIAGCAPRDARLFAAHLRRAGLRPTAVPERPVPLPPP
jgi:uncharacterized protein YecE (DUF72 family)